MNFYLFPNLLEGPRRYSFRVFLQRWRPKVKLQGHLGQKSIHFQARTTFMLLIISQPDFLLCGKRSLLTKTKRKKTEKILKTLFSNNLFFSRSSGNYYASCRRRTRGLLEAAMRSNVTSDIRRRIFSPAAKSFYSCVDRPLCVRCFPYPCLICDDLSSLATNSWFPQAVKIWLRYRWNLGQQFDRTICLKCWRFSGKENRG